MNGASKAVEEATLNAAIFKELANILKGVHCVLHRLSWKAIHEVGVYQDASFRKAFGYLRYLFNRYTFFHQGEKAV